MKVEITKRQLEAIHEICTTVDSTLGCSESHMIEDSKNYDYDTIMLKELKHIERFFNKNGYDLDLSK